MAVITIKINDKQRERLTKHASEKKKSMSHIIRELIDTKFNILDESIDVEFVTKDEFNELKRLVLQMKKKLERFE